MGDGDLGPAGRRLEYASIGETGVNYEKLPDEVINSVEVIQGDASEDEEVMHAVLDVMKYAKDYPDLRVVLVDCMLLRSQRTVSIARSALEEAAEESDIPVILKPFKGLNYAAHAECLKVLSSLGSPKVHQFIMELARDHMISRVRRCACGCLGATNYVERDEANAAFSLLLDLSSDGDWSVRYAALVGLERFKSHQLIDSLTMRTKEAFEARLNVENEEQLLVRVKARVLLAAMKQTVG